MYKEGFFICIAYAFIKHFSFLFKGDIRVHLNVHTTILGQLATLSLTPLPDALQLIGLSKRLLAN